MTVTVKEQVALLLAVSVAVQATEVTPLAKLEPLGGTQATVTPGQLSEAVAVNVTLLAQEPGAVLTVRFAGQVMAGSWVSLTVTVKEQVALLLAVSVAVQVTVVTPLAKLEPLGGVQATVTPGQLSVAVAV